MKTLRVLIACSGVGHVARGYETVTSELAEILDGAGAVSVTLARGGGPWSRDNGVRLPCLQRFGLINRAVNVVGDQAYLVEQRSFAPFVYALACLGRYDVVHLHDPGLMNAVWHARRMLGGSFAIAFTNGGWLSPEHLTRPDLVQSVTPVDADRLTKAGFADWRVALVPYGTRARSAVERSFDSDGPPSRLIGVGSLNDSSKGFATAIQAAGLLGDVSLRLLGQRDEETSSLEALGSQTLGERFSTATVRADEVPAALAGADAFVLPTHSEGFCMAVLEAMAAGLPCVVSDIPVLKWLAGDAALYAPPDRPELWAAALRQLDGARSRQLSQAGRRRAAAFHWDRLVPDYVAMYQKAAAAGARLRSAG